MQVQTKQNPIPLILLTGGLLGGGYVLARALAVAGVHPVWMLAAQSLAAGVGLSLLAGFRGQLSFRPGHLAFYLIGGLTAMTLPRLVGLFALRELTAGMYSMLVTLTPLVTWLLSSAVAGRFESPVRLLGVLVGFTGISWILAPAAIAGSDGLDVGTTALLLGLATPLLLAAGNVYRALKLPRDVSAIGLAGGTLLLQVPVAATLAVVLDAPAPTPDQYPDLLILGAWTLIVYQPYFRLQAITDAVRFSQIGYVIPLTGIAGGALFLGEAMPSGIVIGLPLVFLGLAITNGHLGFALFQPMLKRRKAQ